MIKVVSTSLILIALFGTFPRSFAQQDAAAVAQRAASEEAVRRTARKIDLRNALANAQALQDKGNREEASKQVERVRRVDPANQDAQHFKTKNDKLVADRVGKEPSKETLERIPEIQHERVNTSILVQDPRVLM